MNLVKKLITLKLLFWFPTWSVFWLLRLMGHKISHKSRVGFSLLWIDGKLILDAGTSIGHFNVINVDNLSIHKGGYIGGKNSIKGPIEIILQETAAIGNRNNIYRAPLGITYGVSVLELGILSKITGNHRVDCTRSVRFGNYSTLAGHDSQLWTHAYYHDNTGPGRFRLDGEIWIGNNVYIGSRSIINGGIRIEDAITVGSNSCVSKSLLIAGSYVSQPLRFIPQNDQANLRPKFNKVVGHNLCEEVYERGT
jgi:acetyltransferase-like isoleucine patch superfamily enzyme